MEIALRAALIAWLAADPALAPQLNAIVEEAPSRTALPWLALAASASADWSCKDRAGREVRIALELHCRGDRADSRRRFGQRDRSPDLRAATPNRMATA